MNTPPPPPPPPPPNKKKEKGTTGLRGFCLQTPALEVARDSRCHQRSPNVDRAKDIVGVQARARCQYARFLWPARLAVVVCCCVGEVVALYLVAQLVEFLRAAVAVVSRHPVVKSMTWTHVIAVPIVVLEKRERNKQL